MRSLPILIAIALSAAGCVERTSTSTAAEQTAAEDEEGDHDDSDANQVVRFRELAVGNYHVCGLADHGDVLCWGMNQFGQLGDGTTLDHGVPRVVSSQKRFVSVSTGFYFSCGLDHEGSA